MPGLPGDDAIEGAPGRVPILESGGLDDEALRACDSRHPRIRLDAEHRESTVSERLGRDAGADPDIENRTAGQPLDDGVDERSRISGAGAVVFFGIRSECLRDLGVAVRGVVGRRVRRR